MKKCRNCKQMTVKESHGIAVSKWCVECKKQRRLDMKQQIEAKAAAKKAKHLLTKGYIEKKSASLHEKAWTVWSRYIRSRAADEFGMVKCYTCPQIKHWKELQAGHYWHRRLDFDPRNIHPQCPQCNKNMHGNLAEYAARLTIEIGVEEMAKLRLDANTTKNTYSIEFYQEIIAKYGM